jgi:glycogen debranching enzyme
LYRIKETRGALSDCLHADPGTCARDATPDNAIRPNQLFAITLRAVTDSETIDNILRETACLLTPGAIRSLADQPVHPPLPVYGKHGLLNNPAHPYQGQYQGDEDTQRKPAYHNGTAWNWPFPSYCEALAMQDPDNLTTIAQALLGTIIPLLESGCIAHLPEIMDGDRPHAHKGCWAQAWSATEAYRVLKILNK